MKAAVFLSLLLIVLGTKAWPMVKKSFEFYPNNALADVHVISDCMHVASEPGDYVFKKVPHLLANRMELPLVEAAVEESSSEVCGLYVIGEPDTIIEITMKQYDVNCATGGLMAFVDGWELNGEYFPGIKDHHRELEERVVEFCNNYKQLPRVANKKFFRSSQNAALLQYRIPFRGSFIAHVRFHKITQPCNVLVQDTNAVFNMANFGYRRNCTISALFPATVAVANLKIGGKNVRGEKVNYDCGMHEDRLEVGGSSGLDSFAMEKASDVCGYADQQGPEQAIFCEVTTVRLISTGRYQNYAAVMIRKADENDLDIATLVCAL
ncbi:corticotropin-releasing factor-binding protein isoform X1 [Anastrepha obliqua]|uniref:corticotropin-releasing factor-binding protein isoform X1 n=2 Tax=Anastrepha obliqua TaxID=95512 RepID=UPI00240A18DB|nr:corticotropin-releasing factor-binding protein isoform X1 [Anastrepha obliqua]XP_054725490.1 corticotropin-releasing factor-binding protein isoform X1 [Anastrepha obliqua]XP_054725491.1 corticotropin-releasing factor-binding protein isoform X1 [Anastrepha obliqua]